MIALWSLRAARRDARRSATGLLGADRRAADAALAVDGRVRRHLPAAAAGDRGDGRDAAGDGARHGGAARRRPLDRRALRRATPSAPCSACSPPRSGWFPSSACARTAALCVALNLLCAAAGAALRSPARRRRRPHRAAAAPRATRAALLRASRCTGLLGIGYEVLVVRVLSQVTEDTVYTFALLLAVYLVGSALGAAAYQRWLGAPRATRARLGDRLLGALGRRLPGRHAPALWAAERLKASRLRALRRRHGGGARRRGGARARWPSRLPTLVMGALFSHLSDAAPARPASASAARSASTRWARRSRRCVFGVLLAPALGPKWRCSLVVVGYLALTSPGALARARRRGLPGGVARWRSRCCAPPLAFVDVPEGGRVVSYHEGVMAAVSVVEDADGVARLRINNRQQEGSSATPARRRAPGLLPLLLHPAPRHALFLGLGTGVTASSAAEDPRCRSTPSSCCPR